MERLPDASIYKGNEKALGGGEKVRKKAEGLKSPKREKVASIPHPAQPVDPSNTKEGQTTI